MHEIGDSRDPLRRNVEALDEARLAAGRRGDGDRVGVVDVVGEPDGHASLGGGRKRARDESSGGLLELEVIKSQVEALFRARDEFARVLGDLERALPAVGEGADLERQAYPRARK
jgi:hypothetical protein